MNRIVCHQSPSGWCPHSAPCTHACGSGFQIGPLHKKGEPAGECGLCNAPLMWYVPHTCGGAVDVKATDEK